MSWLALFLLPATPLELPRENVRATAPLSAAEQQTRFRLPPGFSIELVASEPQIQKPINLAFDTAGRLWVSGSVEYPTAAEEGRGRDTIRVLEDTTGDGRLNRVTTFADRLNIPMGLYPYRDGVVAYSIPSIDFLRDTDGDGAADLRETLYGPLDEPRDTHGMQNAFRRGFDGWLYVNHGFANQTTLEGRDGSRIELQSGNTYRVRLDGSRVEQFTWGQVNPFGSALLPDGDIVTSDCHSKPLTLLLRGAYYPSFGKPHDGLGFAPSLMEHGHESTAIDGACSYDSVEFPEEYRGNLFVGNVMTGRVNRDRLRRIGGSLRAEEAEDFLICDDPWFRPVDIQLGPDGALYIADFYNRIIGHYEVPLDHPGRDRTRGRIWRVAYAGAGRPPMPDLRRAGVDALIETLADPNFRRRQLATDELSDRLGAAAAPALRAALSHAAPTVRTHARWALHRIAGLDDRELAAAAADPDTGARIHAQRLAAEDSRSAAPRRAAALDALRDADPRVRRAAADVFAVHPDSRSVEPLLEALEATAESAAAEAKGDSEKEESEKGESAKASSLGPDAHLQHMIRIALKRQFANAALPAVAAIAPRRREAVASIAGATPSAAAAQYLVDYLQSLTAPVDGERLRLWLTHAAAHLPAEATPQLVAQATRLAGGDLELQNELLNSLHDRLRALGRDLGPLRNWAETLAPQLIDAAPGAGDWFSLGPANPWQWETRRDSRGNSTLFLSSLPGGEQAVSTLRSREFAAPPALAFDLCGHRGHPDRPASERNLVRLRRRDGRVVRQAYPPRHDDAQRIEWKLDDVAGQAVWLEIVDGLDEPSYAWLAVSRITPETVPWPRLAPAAAARRGQAAAELAAKFQLAALRGPLERRLAQRGDAASMAAALRAVVQLRVAAGEWPLARADRLASLAALVEASPESELSGKILALAAAPTNGPAGGDPAADGDAAVDDVLKEAMRQLPAGGQQQVARRLAASRAGAAALLELIEAGAGSPRLLLDRQTSDAAIAAAPALQSRLEALQRLAPTGGDVDRAALVAARTKAFAAAEAEVDLRRGQALFEKNCAACHQFKGRGKVVGPQLDGVGRRGAARLLEDMLDPARNVDRAFRSVVVALQDGTVVTGLPRRKTAESLVLADGAGKEITVALADVVRQRESTSSIMPDNLWQQLAPRELNDLAGFLLQR